jgi:hypothetical protein
MRCYDNPNGDLTIHITAPEARALLQETTNGKAQPATLAQLRRLVQTACEAAEERKGGVRR